MQRMKIGTLVVTMLALFALVLPAAAQTDDSPVPNTITVIGSGSAAGTPDMANLILGVERTNNNINTAFNEVNTTIDAVIEALVEAGVAREDIRTANLSVFQDRSAPPGPADSGMNQINFVVRNEVQITVRSIDLVPDVLTVALESGANNVFGLNFSISDTSALESDARSDAMADAEARASELAGLIGAELGDVVAIRENVGGGGQPFAEMAMGLGGGGGAPIEPGRLSVGVNVQVTYRIVR